MCSMNRRGFLTSSAAVAAGPLLPDLGFLAPISWAAAADTEIDPKQVRLSPSIEVLVKLIQTTPREKCIPVFVEQLQAGLSYQDFLSALFLATIEHGDPHQVAGVYSAHRVSSEARTEERLLPLFWALDRLVPGSKSRTRGHSRSLPVCQKLAKLPPGFERRCPTWTQITLSAPSSCLRAPKVRGRRCP